MSEVQPSTARRRRILLRAIAMAVAATVLATIVLTVIAVTYYDHIPDKLVAAGDVLVGATLLLAVIAALVALLAYAVSTGLPDLQISVQFDRSSANNPTFEATIGRNGVLLAKDSASTENYGKVFLRNNSGYSARNPAVIVRLNAMMFRASNPDSFERDWASMEFSDTMDEHSKWLTVVQWDGGPNFSIHGHSTRRLPDLQFSEWRYIADQDESVLSFEILADGYRKEVSFPIKFIVDGKPKFPRENKAPNSEWL